MTNQTVNLSSSGPPETILPEFDKRATELLTSALGADVVARREKVSSVVAAHPTFLAGWASIGDLSAPGIDAYMAYRVGYHRGLDTLRANGWRGSGYVRWSEPTNRGFLRCLRGLGEMAAEIGENDEAERINLFLLQLDPTGIPES